jgi:hypothetical protein
MNLRFNWAISLPPDHANLFFLRIAIKNVQHPRNSIPTRHAQGALHNLKPPTNMSRPTTASSESEGKKLDGFPVFSRNLEQTIGQSNSHVNSSGGAVSSSHTTSPIRLPCCLVLFPALTFYRSYDLPNRNTCHFALRISWPFPVTIESRIDQVQTFHTPTL